MPGEDDTGEKGDAEKAGGGERAASLSEDDPNIDIQEVLRWATGVRDIGVLEDLRWSLPGHVLKDNIRRFKESKDKTKEVVKANVKILINPDSLASRNAACQAYHEFLTEAGTVDKKRKPKGHHASFFDARVTWSRKFTMPTTKKAEKLEANNFGDGTRIG